MVRGREGETEEGKLTTHTHTHTHTNMRTQTKEYEARANKKTIQNNMIKSCTSLTDNSRRLKFRPCLNFLYFRYDNDDTVLLIVSV
jgi:hypothetical protein